MNKNNVGIAIVSLVVGVGIGYLGGNTLRPATPAQNVQGGFAGTRGGGMRGGDRGGGFLSGTVAAKDAASITINTRDGNSRVVLVTPATSVSKSVGGAISDVSVGSSVTVSGTTNSDGSISASLIQLRPAVPSAGQ